jgi:tRNA nucleotidyltransferase/poly(A) polymerase
MQPVEKLYTVMPVPEEIALLKSVFKSAGGKLYLVGGCVRDFVLYVAHGKPFAPKDYDVVTDLHPDNVISMLSMSIRGGTLPSGTKIREVGKSFGVVLVTLNGKDYEIATFREDAKTGDGRRPDFVVFSTIDKDASRRDLTINALYYDLEEKCVLDFHGGIRHLFSKSVQVVFVGAPLDRIAEDRLRVMRFVRFHCRVNAGGPETVHRDTREAIRQTKMSPWISAERIREELIKGLESCLSPQTFLLILEDVGLLQQAFSGLVVKADLLYERTEYDKGVRLPRKIEPLLAQILRYNEPGTVKEQLVELKYTAQEATDVAFLIKLSSWKDETQVVDFKKALARVSLGKYVIRTHLEEYGNDRLLYDMIDAPFPTVRGEVVMQETYLQGKALGEEIVRREIENFRTWRNG